MTISQTFNKLQINLDDTEDADVLSHLVTAIQFIEAELEKGRGVLVHCQAGLSELCCISCWGTAHQIVQVEARLSLLRT